LAAIILLVTAVAMIPGDAHAAVSRSQQIRAHVFKLLTEGIKAYKENRPKDAIPLLEEAAGISLNSFKAYYYLGLAYMADRKYLKAIEPLEIAIDLDPVNLQAHVALGDCYLKRGDPEEALAEYHRVLAIQNDYAPGFDGLGRAAEVSGDIEKAVEHYRKATELNPGFPDPSLNLGDLFMREGRYAEAIELFLRAIRVRPDFAAAYNRLGAAYATQRLGNEAIAALRHAETLDRGNPWHAVTIGRIFLGLDNLVQAERELARAQEMDPDYLEAYMVRCDLLRRLGRFDEAIRILDEGLARDVDDEKTMISLREKRADLVLETDRFSEISARMEETEQAGADVLVGMAGMQSRMGDHAAAVESYEQALAIEPALASDPAVLGQLGYSALRSEMFAEASEALRTLTEIAPDDAAGFINLGLARMGLGDSAGAEEALRRAAELKPGDHRPHVYLGNMHVRHGRTDKAIESFRTALTLLPEEGEVRRRLLKLMDALQGGGS
jgi:tetratricopeptide (TPR) repeat protein